MFYVSEYIQYPRLFAMTTRVVTTAPNSGSSCMESWPHARPFAAARTPQGQCILKELKRRNYGCSEVVTRLVVLGGSTSLQNVVDWLSTLRESTELYV